MVQHRQEKPSVYQGSVCLTAYETMTYFDIGNAVRFIRPALFINLVHSSLLVFLSGCASTNEGATGILYSSLNLQPDQPAVVVFKNYADKGNLPPHLYVDEVKYAAMAGTGFAVVYLTPGEHKLDVRWPVSPIQPWMMPYAELYFSIQNGEVRYFMLDQRDLLPPSSVLLGIRRDEGYFKEIPESFVVDNFYNYREVEYFPQQQDR